jgi:hypothetical protein
MHHSRAPRHRTLAITWPQGVCGEEDSLAEAAQVHGGVRWNPAGKDLHNISKDLMLFSHGQLK